MRGVLRYLAVLMLSAVLSGCAMTAKNTQTGEAESIFLYPLDFANDGLIEIGGLYHLVIGTLEWVGDKTEDTTEATGDLYKSL